MIRPLEEKNKTKTDNSKDRKKEGNGAKKLISPEKAVDIKRSITHFS